jgi:3-hydroxybutyryl-CoA dehydratase
MTIAPAGPIAPGTTFEGAFRVITEERLRWYGDAVVSVVAGEVRSIGSNIHTDESYAREQGLETVIADGMIVTNWLSSLLIEQFGEDYLRGGELRTKYIKPIPIGAQVRPVAEVTGRNESGDGAVCYALDVWIEDPAGLKLAVGDASVRQEGRDRPTDAFEE